MNRLQQLRLDEGMTLAQLAESTGVSTQTVANLEQGKGAWPSTLKALGDHFKVPASSLLLPAEHERDVA